jgi:hypothetical protein
MKYNSFAVHVQVHLKVERSFDHFENSDGLGF